MLSIVLLLVLQDQEPVKIPKAHRALYTKAVTDCKEAGRLLETDPKQAVELLDAILKDDRVAKRECRLRLEMNTGGYGDPYDFYPYQYRGRACLLIGEKEGTPEKAKPWLQRAIDDLKESVRLGLSSSGGHLKSAQTRMDSLKETQTDLEPEFRRPWQAHIDAGRFVAARDYVRSKGEVLSEAKRKSYESETERLCGEHVALVTDEFARALERASGRKELIEMRRDRFESSFGVVESANLIQKSEAMDWCQAVRETLRQLREGKETLSRLFDHAVASVPLAADGPNRWFSGVVRLAEEEARERIESCVAKARDAAAPERRKLRGEAESVRSQWQTFDQRLREAAKGRPSFLEQIPAVDLGRLRDDFPVEEDLATPFHSRLESILEAEAPEAAMAKFAQELARLRTEDSWPRRALESRQAVLRYSIIAGTFLGWLAGKTTDDIVSELRKPGRDLKEMGGTLDESRLGSKIQQVFERLR